MDEQRLEFCVCVSYPRGVDAAKIAQFCLNREVILAPGNAFSQAQSAGQLFVLILPSQTMIIFIRLLQKHFSKSL